MLRWSLVIYQSALHEMPMFSGGMDALLDVEVAFPFGVGSGTDVRLLAAQSCMGHDLAVASLGLCCHHQTLLSCMQLQLHVAVLTSLSLCNCPLLFRSVFAWASADAAPQISLSSTLAPPITLIHSSVILPPLPISDVLSTIRADQYAQATNPAVVARQQASLQQPPTLRDSAPQGQFTGDPGQQQQLPHNSVQAAGKHKHTEAVATVAKHAAPVGQQRVQAGSVQTHSSQPSTVQPELHTQDQQSRSAAAQLITSSVHSQPGASPKRWHWQRSSPNRQQASRQDTGPVAGMQGPAHGFSKQVSQHEVTPQAQHQAASVDQTVGSSPSKAAAGGATEARPSRWLRPVGVRWQGGKHKPPLKAMVRIRVQGSMHSMPVRAQLHVMDQTWCKARLLPSGMLQHRAPSPDAPMGQQSGDSSWRQSLMHRLPWLRTQSVERQDAQQGILFFQAEVPVALLHAVVDDTTQQLRDQQQQNWDEKHPSLRASQAPQQQEVNSPTEQPAMLLRLQTDFQTREQSVQMQLPVVWLLGTDPPASQAVWQMLTTAPQPPHQASTAHSNLPGDGKAGSAWQSAQQKFRQAMFMVRRQEAPGQLLQPQPQLEAAVVYGVQYVRIQATRMQAVDMVSCLLMLLTQFTRDSVGAGPMQLEGSLQRLPARLRAFYHKQELQYLQSQLQHFGPPSGVLLALGGSIDLKQSHAIGLLMKQANVMGIMRMGVTLYRGAHIGSEGLFSIPSDDWVKLSLHSGNAHTEMDVMILQQRLRASLMTIVSGLGTDVSKL